MKEFSENKFKEMALERRARVTLDLILSIEAFWEDEQSKGKCLELLKKYFLWFDFYNQSEPLLKKIAHLEFNIAVDMSRRQLLDIAVPLERFLKLSVKDENIFQVTHLDGSKNERKTYPFVLVLDHLRSAFNVGSIFRTAECLGVEHIYLVGYTPTPEDRGVQKTAMGTEALLPWSHFDKMDDLLKKLSENSYTKIALETAQGAVSLKEFEAPEKVALFVGNERFGFDAPFLKEMDHCVEIPMLGVKNSLNVANSLSVMAFELVRQWK